MGPHASRPRALLRRLYSIRAKPGDEDAARRGRGLISISLVSCAALLVFAALTGVLAPPQRTPPTLVVIAVMILIQLSSMSLARRGHIDAGGLLTSASLSLCILGYLLYVQTYTFFIWFMTFSVIIASITVRPGLIWAATALNGAILALLYAMLPHDPGDPALKLRLSIMLSVLLVMVSAATYVNSARTRALFVGQLDAMRELTHARDQLRDALALAQEGRRQAEAASRAKSTFLANMSHELRTPLNAIIGYAELLSEDLEDDQHVQDLLKIQGAGQHLLNIISDVLDLSRVEAGKMSLRVERVLLDDLLHDLEQATAPQIARQRNRLRVARDARCPEHLHTDALRLRQILLNLLSNAAKFTQDGVITLRLSLDQPDDHATASPAPQADASAALEVAALRVEVQDTGVGIPPEAIERIFEEFVQADDSTTRKVGGTGLGLALSKRLARLLGATLTASSVVGQGSTFTLRVPLEAASLASRTSADAPAAAPSAAPSAAHVEARASQT